jgi:hypothetical protein
MKAVTRSGKREGGRRLVEQTEMLDSMVIKTYLMLVFSRNRRQRR